ncbi:hypothetical protein BpHYR1_010267 [Brachionus plicatilis]|uniref:Uncharacterized protein n=1 Tax=Brachionus plicatilis TaxID=10195 RepID=A0A3M7SMZ0_BRAPC|nr:hypothetical protein BpHYR1_010267 [Brachionus plicatilis]
MKQSFKKVVVHAIRANWSFWQADFYSQFLMAMTSITKKKGFEKLYKIHKSQVKYKSGLGLY